MKINFWIIKIELGQIWLIPTWARLLIIKSLTMNENPTTSMFLFCAGILVILPLVDSCLRKRKKDLEKNGKKTEKNCPSINFTDLASAAGGGALFR